MGLKPTLKKKTFFFEKCSNCGKEGGIELFSSTNSPFYPSGHLPICNDCIKEILVQNKFSWTAADQLCQYAGIPFVPREWERLREMNGEDVFPIYANIFQASEYDGFGWDDYNKKFIELRENRIIDEELPEIREKKYEELRERWGGNYDEEALNYLEQLYQGLLSSQNVNGPQQVDQAYKICKISYEIDCRIREGTDFDKLLSSYEKLNKLADFTPKNAKNAADFDSVGELCRWLEKRGWRNQYYDNVTRDVVDETMKNIQAWNQRLYMNESSIGEDITNRLEALQRADDLEKSSYYLTESDNLQSIDDYENDGFDALIDEDFCAEV